MILERPASARGQSRADWIDSRHTFSFSRYYDPQWMGFGPLRGINEDVVAPGPAHGDAVGGVTRARGIDEASPGQVDDLVAEVAEAGGVDAPTVPAPEGGPGRLVPGLDDLLPGMDELLDPDGLGLEVRPTRP